MIDTKALAEEIAVEALSWIQMDDIYAALEELGIEGLEAEILADQVNDHLGSVYVTIGENV